MDQNLCRLLSKKRAYSPDVVQHGPTGTCRRSDVGRQGESTRLEVLVVAPKTHCTL